MTAPVYGADRYPVRMSIAPEGAWLREARTELQQRLGARVRELRTAVGWSQAQLGERIGQVLSEMEPNRPESFWTQQTAVSRIEGGRISIGLEMVQVLAKALDVDPIVLTEWAFKKAPRDAEEIEKRRREQFTEDLDQLYEERTRGPLGAQALEAITEVLLHWPDQEAEAFVRTLRRWVTGRRAEEIGGSVAWSLGEEPGTYADKAEQILMERDRVREIVSKILGTPGLPSWHPRPWADKAEGSEAPNS